MTDSEKILPCPFCGAGASVEKIENRFSVGCDSTDEADCMGYQSLTTFSREAEAVAAWNKRGGGERELDRLRRFVDFVNLWIYREGAGGDAERLSMIQFHPVAKKAKELMGE
jgi:hypothetical protein